jgi:hypothetical protein
MASFELGTKEWQGIKDASVQNASLIPCHSFIPNSLETSGIFFRLKKRGLREMILIF